MIFSRRSIINAQTPSLAPGLHLLADLWGARHLQDIAAIESALRKAVAACGATLLHLQLHGFGENAGVTGVAILAESHISIHTWPEIDYLALDIFMCGGSNPHRALEVLKESFQPRDIRITEHARGQLK